MMKYSEKIREEIEKMRVKAEEGQKKENSSALDDDIEMIRGKAEEAIKLIRDDREKADEIYELFVSIMSLHDSIDYFEKRGYEEGLSEDEEMEINVKTREYHHVLAVDRKKIRDLGWIYNEALSAYLLFPGASFSDCIWYAAYNQMNEAVDAHYLSAY